MSENTTVARPYAEAVFNRAVETDSLETWSQMLEFLATVTADNGVAGLIANPGIERARLANLILEIGGGRLSDEGANLVRLLAQNDRLAVMGELYGLFEKLRHEKEGAIDVEVAAAYPVNPAQEQRLAEVLSQRLGRAVKISSVHDKSLLGGIKIRAGDLVIDGSVRGQLDKLAAQVGA